MKPVVFSRQAPVMLRDPFSALFEDVFSPTDFRSSFPLIDMEEKDGVIVVTADVPNMDKENISIDIENNVLKISGKKSEDKEEKDENKKYYLRERISQEFYRAVHLPKEVDIEKADAKVKNGTLILSLPVAQRAKSTKVAIK